MSDRIEISIENHIAHVSLARPEKRNALDGEMFKAIIDTGYELEKNEEVRCVVLSGKGKGFCAGLDLSNFDLNNKNGLAFTDLMERTHDISNKFQQVSWQWRALSVPVIAAVHGIALGGGLQIMMGADIKYVHPDTQLSVMEMKWGIIPDMAGTQLARHNIREDIFKELTYTNRRFNGAEAVQYGFATHLSEDPIADALQLATEIVSKNPDAIVEAKRLVNEAPYLDAAQGLLQESKRQGKVIMKDNQLESVFSNMQKRKGNFKNYR